MGDGGTLLLWNPIDSSWRNIEHGLTTADLHAIGENAIVGSDGSGGVTEGVSLGFYWRMWQRANSATLKGGLGTARAA